MQLTRSMCGYVIQSCANCILRIYARALLAPVVCRAFFAHLSELNEVEIRRTFQAFYSFHIGRPDSFKYRFYLLMELTTGSCL
jgi:hypothetical protein